MRALSLLVVTLAAVSCTEARQDSGLPPLALEPEWRVGGFESPESVLFNPDTGFLYVSNVAGGGGDVDGNGFISRLTPDGEIDTLRWAEGDMSAPKGLARLGDRLFTTDITEIVEIGMASGAVLRRFPVEGAGFLNDAVADEDGRVFVSDSATGRIHVLEDGQVSVWAEDPLMAAANGLWLEADRMLLITMADRLVAIDRVSRAVTLIAEGVGNGDGLAADGHGGYLANEWPGQTYRISPDGEVVVIADVRADETYTNDFTIVDGILYTPHFNSGEVSASRIVVAR
tara:strand:+ start:2379 stop:3236 length:858 start_codon:yes stop_codon:yes gene_type:complete